MPTSDVALTFDTSGFEQGAARAQGAMDNLKKTGSSVSGGITKAFGSITRKLAGLAAGFFAVRGVMRRMPEIGKVFGTAGDILSKNLLWPLRKALMPILQGILDWTRENRGTFVKWGETIANAFRAVVSVAKVFWNILKEVGGAVRDILGRFLGFMNRDFQQTMNMMQAKLVFIGQGVAMVFERAAEAYRGSGLESLVNSLVNAFVKMFEYSQSLSAAFREGFDFKAVGAGLDGVFDAISGIFEVLFPKGGDVSWLESTFSGLGEVLSQLTVGGLALIEVTLKTIKASIEWLIENIPKFARKWEEVFGGAESRIGTGSGAGAFLGVDRSGEAMTFGQSLSRMFSGGLGTPSGKTQTSANPMSVKDAIIQPNGRVIKTDPNDTITAQQDPQGSFQNSVSELLRGAMASPGASRGGNGQSQYDVSMTVSLDGANINVNEGSAERVGYSLGEGLGSRIRDELLAEAERRG